MRCSAEQCELDHEVGAMRGASIFPLNRVAARAARSVLLRPSMLAGSGSGRQGGNLRTFAFVVPLLAAAACAPGETAESDGRELLQYPKEQVTRSRSSKRRTGSNQGRPAAGKKIQNPTFLPHFDPGRKTGGPGTFRGP